jgi:hypothetical protein
MDLNLPEDPVWHFISCRHRWITSMLENAHRDFLNEITGMSIPCMDIKVNSSMSCFFLWKIFVFYE